MKTYTQKGNTALLIINQRSLKKILIDQIVLLKGDANYTIFHLEGGTSKVVPHNIKFFESYLETKGFVRIHRTYMINPTHIKSIDAENHTITMSDGLEAIISRRREKNLRKTSIYQP
ncbi:MAG: LytTR family transcriptional regulator [Arcicella sp.]|jgi:two-component system LytT family response regulator|nr:LytTR family transcriptional regulator [Arcicella sp.]